METQESNNWQINYNYIESQLNNLVRTSPSFNFAVYDNYGNKTKYFRINQKQFEQIEKVLKEL